MDREEGVMKSLSADNTFSNPTTHEKWWIGICDTRNRAPVGLLGAALALGGLPVAHGSPLAATHTGSQNTAQGSPQHSSSNMPDSAVFENAPQNAKVHITYHWHLHQPLYWPAPTPGKGGAIQTALDSIDIKAQGGGFYPGSPVAHPENKLVDQDTGAYDPVFSKEDRLHIYQNRGFDALQNLLAYPDAGVQVSYTGSLMANVKALGEAERYGYTRQWKDGYQKAQKLTNAQGLPRADMVGITYHHGLAPLLPPAVLRKELAVFREAQRQNWGDSNSKGFFPPELAFSIEMIPELLAAGYQWAFVPAHHLARATENYLAVAPFPSSSTWNADPPNRADQRNQAVPKTQWWSGTLDGRGAILPVPLAYLPHYAEYVDPQTEKSHRMIVVPADDVLGYRDGYGTMGTQEIDQFIAPWRTLSARPPLVVFAHDGDNAWGGGYSYYFESVPQFAQKAEAQGHRLTTVQTYLTQYPVPTDDIVHVEDGSWVNPEGDFGGPSFTKWLFPPMRSPLDPFYRENDPRTYVDVEKGFSASLKSWAAVIAGAHLCEAAENLVGPERTRMAEIHAPQNPTPVELCWHQYLAGLDSGFTYYGDSLDDEVKPGLATNLALEQAQKVFAQYPQESQDITPPTLLKTQRWPHNPGGMGWGVTTKWRRVGLGDSPPHSKDFTVWSLAYDWSGIKSANVYVRADEKGRKNPEKIHLTYRTAPGVGLSPWREFPMKFRTLHPEERGSPPQSGLNYFIKPKALADVIWAQITGYSGVLVNYYVEVEDRHGLKSRSPIQHVWIEG